MLEEIKKTAAFIDAATSSFAPEVGIILGTGLGGFADKIDTAFAIEYKDIPGFPVSTVEGHKGRMIFGTVEGRKVVAMQGRFHYYEGYTMQQVTFPVRVMQQLGIKYLFVSNASGGINTSFRVGDLMVITDHINLMPNPLIGRNIAELGPRFPDMHNCYDKALIAKATAIAEEENIKLQYGVYVGGTGPTFETQAEYRYFKNIGGDAAGMSTVPEVIVARHMSIPVFGVSVITNCGLSDEVGDHEDVQRQGKKAGIKMEVLFKRMIKQLYDMVNKVILVGNVGIDPEVRTTESGVKVARIRLATTERLFDRQANEAKEHTEWHTITLWRGLADVVDRYVRKGTQIYVEGRLRTREWMDKDNNKRYTTEIMADVMNLLGRRSDNPASDSASSGYGSQQQAPAYGGQPAAGGFQQPAAQQPAAPAVPADDPDDLPF